MKRIFSFILTAAILLTSLSVSAYFPEHIYNAEPVISLCNVSSIGSVTASNAAFQIDIGTAAVKEQKYYVEWSVDGEAPTGKHITFKPGSKTVKVNFPVKNGIHDLTVKLYKNDSVIKTFSKEIWVMDLYDYEFMQELSGRGANIHANNPLWSQSPELGADLLSYGGYRFERGGKATWISTEKHKKIYDFSVYDQTRALLKSRGINPYLLTNQANGHTYPSDDSVSPLSDDPQVVIMRMPQNQSSLQAWSDYVLRVVEHDPSAKFTEIWNEPNLFNKAGMRENAMAYVDLFKAASVKLDYNGYTDFDLHSLSLADKKNEFMPLVFSYGLYPYTEALSQHVYVSMTHEAFMDDQAYEAYLINMEDEVVGIGGWKEKYMTETGFTSPPENPLYYTEEQATRDIVKIYAMLDSYDYAGSIVYELIDSGSDPQYSEDNFGQVGIGGRLKGSYLATTEFNIRTEGAVFIGELSFGDDTGTKAYMYHKDGKPIVVAWTYRKDGSSVEWELPGESADIYDMYGNKLLNGVDKVSLTDYPVYIENLSDKWYGEFAASKVLAQSNEWKKDNAELVGTAMIEEFDNIISDAVDSIRAEHTAEDIAVHLDNMKNYGIMLINLAKDDKLEDIEASAMAYQLFRIMERFNALYVTAYEGEDCIADTSRAKETISKANELYKKHMKSMQFSDAILYHVKKYSSNAELVSGLGANPNKAGVVNAYSNMSSLLCDWFDAFSSFEDAISMGYLIQTPYMEKESYVNENVTITVNTNNYSKTKFRGKIKIFDDEGTVVAETKEFTQDGDGSFNSFKLTFRTKPAKDDSGYGRYFASYVDSKGNVLYTQPMDILVTDKFKVSSVPCTKSISELTSIPIKIENVTDKPQTAYISMKSDENFTFAKTELEVELAANESKIIEVPVNDIKETKYHFYTFSYEIVDEYGSVITADEEILNFTTVVKAEAPIDVANWDGDISEWADAYPIYVNPPKNPSDPSTWQFTECSSRFFVKWDNNNMYILVDVYDEAFLQEYEGSDMWQGDSVQISFDPLNDGTLVLEDGKTVSYKPDDYELGFSRTSKGNEFHAWQSPAQLSLGEVDWFKLIHDYNRNITRYLIRLDRSVISTLKLSEGASLGMNLVINDADVLGREGFYQFTLGTADKKNPDMYADFILSTVTPGEMIEGKATEIFPAYITGN